MKYLLYISICLFFVIACFLIKRAITNKVPLRNIIKGQRTSSNFKVVDYALMQPRDRKNLHPLLVILHGAGERGSDNMKQLDKPTVKLSKILQDKYSSYVFLPQCPVGIAWTINPKHPFDNFNLDTIVTSPILETVYDILQDIITKYPVDKNRIYIMGYSMGGTGTWEFILRHPGLFAAAVPICGASDPTHAFLLQNISIWTFIGENDPHYKLSDTKEMVLKIKEFDKKEVKLTVFPNSGHAIWDRVFEDRIVLNWLYSQSKTDHL
jgi:predicted peptidase